MKRVSHSCCQSSYIIILLFIIMCLLFYIFYRNYRLDTSTCPSSSLQQINTSCSIPTSTYSIPPPLNNPYIPPLKRNLDFPPVTSTSFTQVGILTNLPRGESPKQSAEEETEQTIKIIPLMGRKIKRDKYQYYTVSNEGTKNMKLNVFVKNKNGMNENGVDMLYDKDIVYVPSLRKHFHVEIYENMDFAYTF